MATSTLPDGCVCGWFLRCTTQATKFRAHPVLGEVPICDRCDEKIEAIGGPARSEGPPTPADLPALITARVRRPSN
jgi:hypothetical protein